jgi:hypothetical protein
MMEFTLNEEFVEREDKIIADSITFLVILTKDPNTEFLLLKKKSSEEGTSKIIETSRGRWHCLKIREWICSTDCTLIEPVSLGESLKDI